MLAREVLYLRGIISRKTPWDVIPDLYFFREPEDIEKEEQAAALAAAKPEETYPTDWNTGAVAPAVDYQAPAAADWDAKPDAAASADWGAQPTGTTNDWGAGDASAGWD